MTAGTGFTRRSSTELDDGGVIGPTGREVTGLGVWKVEGRGGGVEGGGRGIGLSEVGLGDGGGEGGGGGTMPMMLLSLGPNNGAGKDCEGENVCCGGGGCCC